MIVGYRDKRTRDFAEGKRVKAFDGIRRKVEMKLDQLGSFGPTNVEVVDYH
jgi:plasmid maintenance system killer protein